MAECSTDHHPSKHDHPEHPNQDERSKAHLRLKKAFIFALFLFGLEVFGSYVSGSLALLADAFHVLSDLIALGITLISAALASKPRDSKRSYGYYRLEVLAALFNGILLIGLAFFIVTQAWERFQAPSQIHPLSMFWVALFGLGINLIMMRLLHSSHSHNLNLRGAYLHIMGDTLASVGVVIGAAAIYFTGLNWIDTLASLFVSLLILIVAGRFVYDSCHVLLEGAPKHMNPKKIEEELLEKFKTIRDIHDFHLWEITSHLFAMTAHIKADVKDQAETRRLIDEINAFIRSKYGIGHTTFQVEPSAPSDDA